MLEQADQSGRLDPEDFDEQTIIDLFGKAGAQMLIIDAIIGNGDRHAGNFGWLRNAGIPESMWGWPRCMISIMHWTVR